jgi:hypothetical protein
MKSILYRGSIGVIINNQEGEFIQTGKWLRQGDPLSHLLFNIVVDVLSRMLPKARNIDMIKGLGCELVEGGVVSLQYAYDTILFMDKDVNHAENLKWILTYCELMSGMRVNYHKSELIPINCEDEEERLRFASIFGCPVGDFPIKYLGIPLHYNKLRREDMQPLIDKIIKRIVGWRGKLLTQASRLILIKNYLASIPVYLMSFLKFPRWAIDMINTHMTNCFWGDYEGHKKLHLANWHLICMRKEHGGLGVPRLKDLNLCMLGNWVK